MLPKLCHPARPVRTPEDAFMRFKVHHLPLPLLSPLSPPPAMPFTRSPCRILVTCALLRNTPQVNTATHEVADVRGDSPLLHHIHLPITEGLAVAIELLESLQIVS
jgi:hypothetical protein